MTNLRQPSKEHRCTYLKIPVSLLVKYILLFQAAFQTLVGCRGQSARPDHWGQMFPERAGDEATTMIRERKMHYSSIVIFVPLAPQLCSQLRNFWKTIKPGLNSTCKTHVCRQIKARNVGFKISERQPHQRGKTNPNPEQGNAQDATEIVSKLISSAQSSIFSI